MRRADGLRQAGLLVAGCGAAFLLGGLTSLLQTVLPLPWNALANSASGWTLLTALVVAAAARRTWTAALLGIAAFALLNLGYTVATVLRGFPDAFSGFWVVIGFVVGAPIGIAALRSTRRGGVPAAVGAAVLAGIGIGDGTWGLVSLPFSWAWWTLALVAGVAVLVAALLRASRIRDRVVAGVGTLLVAGAYLGVYALLNG